MSEDVKIVEVCITIWPDRVELSHVNACVEAPKIGLTTRGIPTRSGPWLAAPYPFGIAGPTGDNGTSFPI